MSKTVIGLFETPRDARAALDALEHSDSRFERVLVQTGAELAERMRSMAPGDEAEHLWRGARQLFEELGVRTPTDARPINPDDGVLMVVVPNEGADATAAFLDDHGAIDIEARSGRLTEMGEDNIASGLNPGVGGRIPPNAESTQTGAPAREKGRSEAENRARQTCARIFNC